MGKYDLYEYEDYMYNQPMSDGKEIRYFLDDIEKNEKERVDLLKKQIKKEL